MGLSHIAAYRKDAAEQLWRHRGLPTPETVYYSGQAVFKKAEIIAQELKNSFSDFDALVVSGVGGSGGETVALVERNALDADILRKISDGDKLMIQPCLPLMMSPNVVANITDNGVEMLSTTNQVFKKFGANAGNEWPISDEYLNVETDALGREAVEALRDAGVRGQINIDILVISEEDRAKLGLNGRLFLREANIRPASSSILINIRENARVPNGSKPSVAFMTASYPSVPLPREFTQDSLALREYIEKKIGNPSIGMVITQYNQNSQKANVVIFGDNTVPQSDLQDALKRFYSHSK